MTVPAEGSSSPASRLRTVVLPQPECPMMQVNSPRPIESQRSSNTVVLPPPGAGKRFVMASTEMNFSVMSFRKSDQSRGACERLIEHHAHESDHQNRRDYVGDGKIVPFIPDEIADAGSAHEHFGGYDHQPGYSDRNTHAGENRGRGRRQDDGERATEGAHFQRARDIEPLAPHRRDPEGGVDQHRPERTDEDDEDRREARVLDGIKGKRHPGERRDWLE